MDIFKYQGAGNDFVLIRSLDSRAELTEQEIIRLCDRRYGIGADGLIILESSPVHDFAMRFYNNDGSTGMFCGNGGRCIIDLAWRSGLPASGADGSWTFSAPDGLHSGKVLSHEGRRSQILLGMNDITSVEAMHLPAEHGQEATAWKMNTGTEHLVIFRDNIEDMDVQSEGRRWRYAPQFAPKGVNVNFVQSTGAEGGLLHVRTYERGVEYETLSCGTGIIAAAAASWLRGDLSGKYTLRSTHDTFSVSFRHQDGIFTEIELTGPAELVFKAVI